jgi:hypothetical protein
MKILDTVNAITTICHHLTRVMRAAPPRADAIDEGFLRLVKQDFDAKPMAGHEFIYSFTDQMLFLSILKKQQ